VKEVGENFSTSGPENHGFSSLNSVSWNLNQQEIYEIILERGEGKLSKDGAMVVETVFILVDLPKINLLSRNLQIKMISGGKTQKKCLKTILILFIKT